eukprot:3432202-Prymnesium_polylepis.1
MHTGDERQNFVAVHEAIERDHDLEGMVALVGKVFMDAKAAIVWNPQSERPKHQSSKKEGVAHAPLHA